MGETGQMGELELVGSLYKRLHEPERRRADNTQKKALLIYMRTHTRTHTRVTPFRHTSAHSFAIHTSYFRATHSHLTHHSSAQLIRNSHM